MADSRGKVALMLFIYTHCTDICPYEAVKVKLAHDLLGSDARNAVFVAVTTDPKRDTPAVCAAYSKALGLSDGWHFVGGAAKDVQAVWFNYGIGVTVNPQTDAVAAKEDTSGADESKGLLKGLTESDVNLVGKIEDAFGGGYDVGHSAPFWFVDKKGMVREIMDGDVTPAQIAKDIRALIAE